MNKTLYFTLGVALVLALLVAISGYSYADAMWTLKDKFPSNADYDAGRTRGIVYMWIGVASFIILALLTGYIYKSNNPSEDE
jgi:small-conductance mechanosensitive channel